MLSAIRKIFNNDDFDISYTEKYLVILKLCCLVHVTLIPIFFYLNVLPLVIFNIGSVILYYVLLKTIREDRYMLTFFLAYAEIVVHTILCIFLIGNGFGFQLYIPAVIPVLFFIVFSIDQYGHLKYPIIYSLASLLFFSIANVCDFFSEPVYTNLNENVKLFMLLYNAVIVFTMLIVSSLLFILQIRGSMRKVEVQKQELATLASIDPLTGLLNRRKFTTDMNELIKNNGAFSILLSDIDDFKKINDTYGHDCGDQILVHVTSQFKLLIGSPNLICRWGGEEIIVLYGGTIDEGAAAAELLRTRIANSPVTYDGQTITATITTGVSYYDGSDTIDHVIVKADNALYTGKQNGKNQVRREDKM
jgi:diguanylate cyclase (GGDEF)-like protein